MGVGESGRAYQPARGHALGAVPLAAFVALVLVLYLAESSVTWESPLLLAAVNGLLSVAAMTAAVMAAVGYLHGGVRPLVRLGAGAFCFGAGSVIAQVSLSVGRLNTAVQIYNTCAMIAGVLLLSSVTDRHGLAADETRRRRTVAMVLLAMLVFISVWTMLAWNGLLPDYLEADLTSTPLRNAVLGIAVLSFAAAAIVAAVLLRETDERFFRRYTYGLGFMSAGLAAVVMGPVGSLIGWAGRAGQVVGMGYILACLYLAVREPGVPSIGAGAALASRFHGVQAALAESRAQLISAVEELTEAARINEALSRIERDIHSTFDRDEVLERVADESATSIGADSTVLLVREADDRWVVRYAHNLPDAEEGSVLHPDEAPEIARAMERGGPIAVRDTRSPQWSTPADGWSDGVRAFIFAPLIVRGAVVGGLYFNYDDVRDFSQHQLSYVSRLGTSVGLALANIELYESERTIADRLQEALLSLPSEVDGIDFAHVYHSASDASRVGGDFYDLFELDRDRLGIVIGDVAGKGLDAAVLTSLVKNTIRAHANEHGKTPSDILSLTNDVIFRSTPTEAFVTVFLGVLDRRDGWMVYANAGHTSAGVLRPAEAPRALKPTGPILGAFDEVGFGHRLVQLDVGDTLFLYTDGLTEARGEREFYGERRLFATLSSGTGTASEIVTTVLADVMSFCDYRLTDDVAILAIRQASRDCAEPAQQRLELAL